MTTALIGARSDFSLGESLLRPEDIAEFAANNGYHTASLIDTMNVSGMLRFAKACKKHNVAPIIGARLRICDDLDKTPPKKREAKNLEFFPKVYVMNDAGLKSLYALLSLAHNEEHFYYVPRLTIDELLAALRGGGLAVSSGDLYGALSHPQGVDRWRAIQDAVGAPNAFLELSPIATPLFDKMNELAIAESRLSGARLLVSRPAFYKEPGHADTLDVLSTITGNGKMADPWRPIPYVRDYALRNFNSLVADVRVSYTSLNARFPHDMELWARGLNGASQLAALCQYRWEKQAISLPTMAPNEMDALRDLCARGFADRLGKPQLGFQPTDLRPYAERLVYELGVLEKMGFERYFLLVRDLVMWSKSNGTLVGPGRGSIGGSLVAYLIGITDVDPIRFNLLFERFINPERLDLPDADLDFMTSGRQSVIDYIVQRHGADCVAGISNYSTLASASALRDTARVFELDSREYECTKLVPKMHGKSHDLEQAAAEVPEIDAFRLSRPDLWNHAVRLQGSMRAYGTHAAGIVVAGEPIVHRAPVISKSGFPVVSFDKREVEDQGLIKLDVLGLSTLDILRIATDLVKKIHGKSVDLMGISPDDPEVLEAFARGDTRGVFQFESSGMRHLLKSLAEAGALTFEDIAAATALYRPGPIDSGMMDDYVAVRQGKRAMSFDHPKMEPALRATCGVMVFQESLMQVARDLAGFTMAEADKLRSAMGKKDPIKMAGMRQSFVDGCVQHSAMTDAAAGAIFDKIEKFAGYGFNRSHSVEYSIISVWSMWFKVHYKAAFYAASMSVLDSDKLLGLVKDARADGIEVVPPDINASTNIFEPRFNTQTQAWELVAPFNRIKGLSDKTGAAIMDAREKVGGRFDSFDQFLGAVEKRRCNVRHQQILVNIGAFAEIIPDSLTAKDMSRLKLQMELLPGLVIDTLTSNKVLSRDANAQATMREKVTYPIFGCPDMHNPGQWLTEPCKRCEFANKPHVPPRHGKTARVMIVSLHPSWGETDKGKMGEGLGSEVLRGAIERAGLSVSDFYFTSIIRAKPDKGEKVSNAAITACSGYLATEIDLLKPAIIVACGSQVVRHILKGVKGTMAELLGHVEYVAQLEASILCAPNPAAVHFHPETQGDVDNAMIKVAEMLGVPK